MAIRASSVLTNSLSRSLSSSFAFFFFRQVSNLSTTKEHTLWLLLIEWKRARVLLVIIKKHDTIDERRIIIIINNKCREIERVNIYIWMGIIDWKCSNEMNQSVYIYIERDAAFIYACVRDGQLTQICSLYRAHAPP